MINKLPLLSDPVKYTGLYIFDFGEKVAVGYTAEEIEFLLAEEKYAKGTVYRIYRASSDGTLEIRGVNPLTWNASTGVIFWFTKELSAADAYDRLKTLAQKFPPPGQFELFLLHKIANQYPYALVIRYSQELDDAIASWLLKIQYNSGDHVEGGAKLITQTIANSTQLYREEFNADDFRKSRTRRQVLDTVNLPIQR